jgi:hypothetical protein
MTTLPPDAADPDGNTWVFQEIGSGDHRHPPGRIPVDR